MRIFLLLIGAIAAVALAVISRTHFDDALIQARRSALPEQSGQPAFGIPGGSAPENGSSRNEYSFAGATAQASTPTSPYRDFGVGEPVLGASLAYAVDINTGLIFYLKGDLKARWPIASITKLMTAMVAVEHLPLATPIEISARAVATEGIAGGFSPEERYSVQDLVAAMLLTSSNDAAAALSEAAGGDAQFARLMQNKARAIGMPDTTFVEVTGLSAINQSTLGDLRTLAAYLLMHHPELLELTAARSATVTDLANGRGRELHNINKFAGASNFVGGKTGFIDSAGENLISLFRYHDSIIATFVLGSGNRFGETQELLDFIKTGYKF